jgi:acyl-coenzyme A thioesterase PaaI-like protein
MEDKGLHAWLEDSPLLTFLGVEFVELDPDKVVVTMPVDERHHQPLAYLHGGLNLLWAEPLFGRDRRWARRLSQLPSWKDALWL